MPFGRTGLRLNNKIDRIKLIYPDGELTDSVSYKNAKQGFSWARKSDNFYWTSVVTPGSLNKFNSREIDSQIIKSITIKKALRQEIGRLVSIKGVVSVPPGAFGEQTIYIQDQTAGIQLYFYHHNWPKLKLGSKLRVIGEISSIRGEKRIKIEERKDIEKISQKKIKPIEIDWNDLVKFQGRLVKISGRVSSSAGSTFYLTDGLKKLKIYLKDSTGIDKPRTYRGDGVEVAGILVRTDSGFKLLPRFQDDLRITSASSSVLPPVLPILTQLLI